MHEITADPAVVNNCTLGWNCWHNMNCQQIYLQVLTSQIKRWSGHTRHCYSKKRDLYETENGSRCLYCTEEINYMWVIEQALGQDGWILSKFFFCVFMDRGKVEVYILAKNIQLSLRDKVGQKRIYYMTCGQFFMRDTSGMPEWARWFHLACLGSQSQRSIWVIFSARGASHIINIFIIS